jgi:hypothetical protein
MYHCPSTHTQTLFVGGGAPIHHKACSFSCSHPRTGRSSDTAWTLPPSAWCTHDVALITSGVGHPSCLGLNNPIIFPPCSSSIVVTRQHGGTGWWGGVSVGRQGLRLVYHSRMKIQSSHHTSAVLNRRREFIVHLGKDSAAHAAPLVLDKEKSA